MRDWKSILVSAEDSDDLSEALETLALDNGVSLLVTDADGATLYSAQYNPRGTMNTLPQDTFKELYAQAQASGGETQIEYMGSMQFDLTDLMRQVMLRYGKLKEQDGYVMEFVADGEVYIMGDADKITQELCNLIGNAINYTGADKKIIVRQSLHEHHVRVDVIDSGEGIAAQDIPYVWDRYYKGDKARKRLVSGTGLGLSIVQKILELHGATYGVESKPGMGADFWFAFEIVEK